MCIFIYLLHRLIGCQSQNETCIPEMLALTIVASKLIAQLFARDRVF